MRVVCELGLNTNGSLDTALRMVEAAAEAGADGIKVQAYDTHDFLPEGHPDWAMFADNRLTWAEIVRVQAATKEAGLLFGATPTSLDGVQRLAEMGVDWLKNGSDYLLRHDMIEAMLDTGIETWVSTGMATWEEIRAIPRSAKVMACTSLYPCPDYNANLARLRIARYDGYSDHTESLNTAALCLALGAEMYETHLTTDKRMVGPDHAFSRNPDELRLITEQVWQAKILLGESKVAISPYLPDAANRDKWRVTEGTLRG